MNAELEAELRRARARAERYLNSKPRNRDVPLPEGLELRGVLFGAPPAGKRQTAVKGYQVARGKSGKLKTGSATTIRKRKVEVNHG